MTAKRLSMTNVHHNIMRMYDKLEANDCWIADNYTLDIISTDGTTKHRFYLTAFLRESSVMAFM